MTNIDNTTILLISFDILVNKNKILNHMEKVLKDRDVNVKNKKKLSLQ